MIFFIISIFINKFTILGLGVVSFVFLIRGTLGHYISLVIGKVNIIRRKKLAQNPVYSELKKTSEERP
jgi:hypothetical protein